MRQIAILRQRFEDQWEALTDAEDRKGEGGCRRWISRFESLLIDTFSDVFEEAKKSLEPKPSEFAYKTVRDWCLAADEENHGRILFEVENHLFWEDVLHELVPGAASELSPADLSYSPESPLCLETLGGLPSRSRDLRKMLSQIHPHLIAAMKNVLAQKGCATVQEAVENFPVLRGIKEDELERFRGSSSVTENTASKELLNAHLRTMVGEGTVDRYFRPTEFSPR